MMDKTIQDILSNINQSSIPDELKQVLVAKAEKIGKLQSSTTIQPELDKEVEYIKFVVSLPFAESSQDILDIKRAAQILDQKHFGLRTVKDRILEYLSVLTLSSRQGGKHRSQILSFVGLVGSGKTSLAYSIAESLGRQIIRIPFGGLGSVKELRGVSRSSVDGEPGKILKSLAKVGVNNPVILLDEVDRISESVRSDVMGVLVELLDPEQNFAFTDHYLDYPFDLSKVLFIATANNTANIATAVLDRMELIEMPSYSDEEKITIGKNYLLPRSLTEAGIAANMIVIDDGLWLQVVRPLGFDGGIRSLHRHIQSVVRKVARQIVEGNTGPFNINSQNIGQYL